MRLIETIHRCRMKRTFSNSAVAYCLAPVSNRRHVPDTPSEPLNLVFNLSLVEFSNEPVLEPPKSLLLREE